MQFKDRTKALRFDENKDYFFIKKKILLINSLLEDIHSEFFIKDLIIQSVKTGQLVVPSIVAQGSHATCVFSFTLNYQNYLIFRDIDNSFFIFGQRHYFISDIYFPSENVVLKIDYAPFQEEVVEIFRNYKKNINLEKKSSASFSGFFLSYSRPYHYFYDLLPAFNYWEDELSSHIKFSEIEIFQTELGSFLNPRDIFGTITSNVYKTEDKINDQILHNNKFLLKLGYPLNTEDKKEKIIDAFDRRFIASANHQKELQSKLTDYYFGNFTIWLGICNEKRKWVEQEEAIHAIIDYLTSKHNKITIIVDGMTRPIWVSPDEFRVNGHVARETSNMNRIFNKYKHENNISIISTIGASAAEKVLYSLKSNFFISNFLTDSMYPARFGKTIGIGHGSFKAKSTEHFHPNTAIIRSNRADDMKLINKSSNWARQDYSIDKSRIIKTMEHLEARRKHKIDSLLIGFMNFSVISKNKAGFKERKKEFHDYKLSILNPERLRVRANIFFNTTVKIIIKNADALLSKNIKIQFCIAISNLLPESLIKKFEDLVSKNKDIFYLYKVGIDDAHSWVNVLENHASNICNNDKYIIENENIIVSNFRLDDDDIIFDEYFNAHSKYLNESFAGFYLTFPKGYVGVYDKDYTSFHEVNRPFLAIGLSIISKYSVLNKKFSIDKPCIFVGASHARLINNTTAILDSSIHAYIWTMHQFSDTRSIDSSPEVSKAKIKRFISDSKLPLIEPSVVLEKITS